MAKRRRPVLDRIRARKRLMQMAQELYEPGDDAEELQAKMNAAIENEEGGEAWKGFLQVFLEQLLPILFRLLLGIK